jgi:hypothetical protein
MRVEGVITGMLMEDAMQLADKGCDHSHDKDEVSCYVRKRRSFLVYSSRMGGMMPY